MLRQALKKNFAGLDVPTIYRRYGIPAKASAAATVHRFLALLHIAEIFSTESER